MRVYEERGVKIEDDTSNEQINLMYFLFWTSTYELLCVVLFFWVDLLPWYGGANLSNFGTKYVYFNSSKKYLQKTGTLREGGFVCPLFCASGESKKSRTSLVVSERSRPKQEKPPARRLQNTGAAWCLWISFWRNWVGRCVGGSVWKRIWFHQESHRKRVSSNKSTLGEKDLQFLFCLQMGYRVSMFLWWGRL